MQIRPCAPDDHPGILGLINEPADKSAVAVPAVSWRRPSIQAEEIEAEVSAGVDFLGVWSGGALWGVMDIHERGPVRLIRHAYVPRPPPQPKNPLLLRNTLAALAAAALAFSAQAYAAPATPEAVVRAYADAANRHDVDRFVAFYAPDIRKYRFPAELRGEGRQRYQEAYAKSFAANPNLKVEIVELIVLGDKVVSLDRVIGLADGRTADEITIYEVREGKIVNMVAVERIVR